MPISLVTFTLMFPFPLIVLLVSHYVQNGDGLKIVVDSRNDAKGAALDVEHHAQPRLGSPGVALPHVTPIPPVCRFDSLHPTVEMSPRRPALAAETFNFVRAENPHRRYHAQPPKSLTPRGNVSIITYR